MQEFNVINKIMGNSGSIVLIIFLAVVFFVFITSVILFFHWKKYAISGAMFAMMETLYLTVVVILLSTAFFSLI